MKTTYEKIETKVRMRLWGEYWRFTPIFAFIIIVSSSDTVGFIPTESIWQALLIGGVSQLLRISKFPIVTIVTILAAIILDTFSSLEPGEVSTMTAILVLFGLIYDHFLLRKEAREIKIPSEKRGEYLDLMVDELEKAITILYDQLEECNIELNRREEAIVRLKKELDRANNFDQSTLDIEKSITRANEGANEMTQKMKKKEFLCKELEERHKAIQLDQKRIRMA